MADDIVQELQDWAYIVDESQGKAVVAMLSGGIFSEAADEIERLRAEVRTLCRRCRMGCHEVHGVVCDECKEARRG